MDVPFIGRKAPFERIVAEIADGPSVVVVTGSDGVGKSRLVEEVGAALRALGVEVEVVFGVRAGLRAPLAPFAHLLETSEPLDDAQALRMLLRALRADGTHRALLVDDAHLLDPGSVALVQQLALRHDLALVLTTCSARALPDDLAEAVLARGAVWESLDRLDRSECEQLVEACLRGDVHPDLAADVWAYSAGSPLLIVELLRATIEGGGIEVNESGSWVASKPLCAPEHLVDVLGRRLERLGRGRDLVGALGIVDSLSEAAATELVGADAVARCVDGGIVAREVEPRCVRLHLAHLLYRQAVQARLDDTERHRLIDWLVAHPPPIAPGCPGDVVNHAELLLAGGKGDAEWFRRAAEICLNRLDPERALRFADAAISHGGGHMDRLVRAVALSRVGRREEALAVADDLDQVADPLLRAIASFHIAYALVCDVGDPAAAVERVAAAVATLPDEIAGELRSRLVNLRFHAGDPLGAIAEVHELVERRAPLPDDVVIGVVNASTVLGRPEVTAHYVTTQWHRVASCPSVGEMSFDTASMAAMNLLLNWQAAHWQLGQLTSRELPGAGLGGLSDQWSVLRGSWLLEQALPATLAWSGGRLEEAQGRLEAALAGAPIIPQSITGLLRAALAATLAARGDSQGARQVIATIDRSMTGGGVGWWKVRAEVETLASEGRVTEAVGESLELARQYAGQEFLVTTNLHDVVRFGQAERVVERLQAQATRSGSTWWDRVCAAHAEAQAAGDAAALLEVADRFAAGGRLVEALEAAAWSVPVARRGSNDRIAAQGRIGQWSVETGRLCTPALVAAPKYLTERELVVAKMAAQGRTNGEIALALGTSARTVGNQLQSVYEKLGVNSRAQLAPLLG